ncbi:MAG: ATP12 family chaperone protein [Pseudorhodobacter sp.]
MTGWAPKRFWKTASVEEAAEGFSVMLDGRSLRSPAKAALILPKRDLAAAIATEWDAQQEEVQPETMPFTRIANSAIDKVAPQFDAVVGVIAAYGASDLLCYRAGDPEELVARQSDAWDPVLDWAAETLGTCLTVTTGVIPVDQPPEAISRLEEELRDLDPFRLAAIHDLVAISGSLVLGLAVARSQLAPERAFDLSRIDEIWQMERWGEDELATEAMVLKRAAFNHAARFYKLCG